MVLEGKHSDHIDRGPVPEGAGETEAEDKWVGGGTGREEEQVHFEGGTQEEAVEVQEGGFQWEEGGEGTGGSRKLGSGGGEEGDVTGGVWGYR